jgi:hypothetical protein
VSIRSKVKVSAIGLPLTTNAHFATFAEPVPVVVLVYFAKVPEIAQVVIRTATNKAEATLIITFFFIVGIPFFRKKIILP